MSIAATARAEAPAAATVTLYGAALLQGLTLVSYPAASVILKTGAGLTDAAYGAIFLPQVALAIVGALGGGALARRIGLERVLAASMAANVIAQLLLAAVPGMPGAFVLPVLLLGTGCLGFGFGATGAPFNSLPRLLFPARGDTALVALHSMIGLGLALGPLLLQRFAAAGHWKADPLILAGIAGALAFAALGLRVPGQPVAEPARARPTGKGVAGGLAWLCAIAVVYAFAEGTLSNWIVVFVSQDRGLSPAAASTALSAFWFALVVGRLLVAALVTRVPGTVIWRALPFAMLAAFIIVPRIGSAAQAVAAFAFAGLACSAFFPLTVAIAAARAPAAVPVVSSLLTAALMIGVGLGSFAIGGLSGVTGLGGLYLLSTAYPALILVLMVIDARFGARRTA